MDKELEDFVVYFGERYRHLIQDALIWLRKRELIWELDAPIDHMEFFISLIASTVKKTKED